MRLQDIKLKLPLLCWQAKGAIGNVNIDPNSDMVGVYDVWTVKDDGKLAVINKVSPK